MRAQARKRAGYLDINFFWVSSCIFICYKSNSLKSFPNEKTDITKFAKFSQLYFYFIIAAMVEFSWDIGYGASVTVTGLLFSTFGPETTLFWYGVFMLAVAVMFLVYCGTRKKLNDYANYYMEMESDTSDDCTLNQGRTSHFPGPGRVGQ